MTDVKHPVTPFGRRATVALPHGSPVGRSSGQKKYSLPREGGRGMGPITNRSLNSNGLSILWILVSIDEWIKI